MQNQYDLEVIARRYQVCLCCRMGKHRKVFVRWSVGSLCCVGLGRAPWRHAHARAAGSALTSHLTAD